MEEGIVDNNITTPVTDPIIPIIDPDTMTEPETVMEIDLTIEEPETL